MSVRGSGRKREHRRFRRVERLAKTLRMAEAMSGMGYWRTDLDTGQKEWSDGVYRVHGLDPETFDPNTDEAIGLYRPEDQSVLHSLAERLRAAGGQLEFKAELTRPDGDVRRVAIRCMGEQGAGGRYDVLFGVVQDITEQERATDRLQESEARYRLLADNATDIIAVYSPEGVFSYISPGIEAALGYRPEDLLGRSFEEFVHPEDIESMRAAYRGYAAAGPDAPPPRIPYRARHKRGSLVWLEAHPKLMRDGQGEPIEFHDLVRDVSHTKRLEAALIDARDRAEAAAQAKSEFLANMSHELRTPLTSVIGFAGLLQASTALPEQERLFADRIGTASDALLSVINDILDYSKLEADAVEMDPQPFSPADLAHGAASLIEDQRLRKGLGLTVTVAPEAPQALVGDEGRLRQVVLNFLSNAVKFTSEGEIRLHVGGARSSDGRWRLRISVSDTGIGVPADKLARLFERFTQADSSTTRTHGGTGLGLAISRRLVELMEGEVGAESRPGEGATFWLEAPLPEVCAVAAGQAPAPSPQLRPARVLVVDDAAANRELVSTLLHGMGLETGTAADGAEAVQAMRRGGFDLVLMDVHMPGIDGLEATRMIRQMDGPAAQIPILALTANVQAEHVNRCLEAGMDGHLAKPISVPVLAAALMKWLEPEAADRTASGAVG